MANEIVKYHNDMNTVALRKFNSVEMNIFMSICSRVRDKGEEIIEFSFDYIKQLAKIESNYTIEQFGRLLDSTYEKLLKTNIRIGNDRVWTRFVLFTKYTIDLDKQIVKISVNKEFVWVLNELTSRFTRYELEEYVDYKSSYTKEFFRRMKQFRTKGIWKISLEDFKKQLDIPENYKICNIDQKVFAPILSELKKEYKLKIKKIYSKKGIGRPQVCGFEFRFVTQELLEIQAKEREEKEKNRKQRLKIINSNTNSYAIYEVLSTYTEDNKIYLKLKKEKTGEIKIYTFDHIQHYSNFLHKYLYK